MMDPVMRTVMSTRIVSTTVTMSSVNEDEHCPYTFAQSAPRNCLHSSAVVVFPTLQQQSSDQNMQGFLVPATTGPRLINLP